ncbi:hypothetical protein SAMN04488242_1496 [Tessaracoccus oleiagri]|uniref:Uncharacterized protein n=2 Tax=Tessaracoccus oleiagri TaxID=686624 RepID=A0A1G9JVL9_9ACTN|nr:hypothetical protein SAMN04488242_1496 [Tessaracoccus oleiagri]
MFAVGAALSAPFFSAISKLGRRTDLAWHAELVIESRSQPNQLSYSVYYWLLDTLSGRGDLDALIAVAMVLVSVAYGLRVALTWLVFSMVGLGMVGRVVGTVAASIAGPITVSAQDDIYLGKLSPVIWHNSTTILAVPFALLLFASTCWLLTRPRVSIRAHVVQLALVLLSGWTKPNFILAFIPALAVWCVIAVGAAPAGERGATFRELWRKAAPSGIVAAAILVTQYVLTYSGPGLQMLGQSVSNVFDPFAVWELWSTAFGVRPFVTVPTSLITPLVLSLLVWRGKGYRLPLVLAWLAVVVGLLQFTLFAEALADGTILFHGNWIWGAQISMAILFCLTLSAFMREWETLPWPKWIGFFLAAFQVVVGVGWIVVLLRP